MVGRIIAALAACCLSYQVIAATNPYLDELTAAAKQKNLAQHPEWLKMLHYKHNLFSGHRTEIMSKEFFNSPEGRRDPEAELNATLASFFSNKKETDKEQNPQCQFIYRFRWLNEQLKFNFKRMKRQHCGRYERWIKIIDPEQITLIFPAGTENAPSSMFGHTLFRVDKKGQTENTRLFSYSINFAADTDETNGFVFAVMGVFGGYPGSFSVMPYYEKVKQYNDMEHRDIWEYQLNLTADEISRLMMHTWELGSADFEYYFFLENCSYQLLSLLDVARPGRNLTDRFSFWAIPGDTVQVILEEKGMLKKTVFRPSVRSNLRHMASYLSSDEQDAVVDLAFGEIEVDSPVLKEFEEKQRALIYVAAYDYLRYLYFRGVLPDDSTKGRLFKILKARNKIPLAQTIPEMPQPNIRFDQGHETSRITTAGGYVNDKEGNRLYNFSEIKFRPAYHDVMDKSEGYTAGAQINFGDFTFRYNSETEELDLHEAIFLDIFSLVARDKFFKPLSFKVQTGLIRRPLDDTGSEKLMFAINGGVGLNFGLTPDFNIFTMIDFSLLSHHRMDNNVAVGIGPEVGIYWRATSFWNLWLSGSAVHYDDDYDQTWIEHKFVQNFAVTTNTALRLSVAEKGQKDKTVREYYAGINWYF